MSTQKRELRTLTRAISNADGNRVQGYFAKFNNLSEDLGGFRERLQAGCFANSLRSNPDLVALWQHDSSQPLGRVSAGNLEVSEDNIGLRFSLSLPDTTLGRDVKELLRQGIVSQCSFGFNCISDSWSQENGEVIRTVKEALVSEGSLVTWPAYDSTEAKLRFRSFKLNRRDDQDDDSDSDFSLDDVMSCENCSLCADHRCLSRSVDARSRRATAVLLKRLAANQ